MHRFISALVESGLSTWLGRRLLTLFVSLTQYRVFAPRTVSLMKFDLLRLHARCMRTSIGKRPSSSKLHFGCGERQVSGWLNVDVAGGQSLVDLAGGSLPWEDSSFDVIAAQHVIEHLELTSELIPLLSECCRVARPGAQIWLSCPDMERVCRSYVDHKGADLIADRLSRPHRNLGLDGVPSQHMINNVFHQGGEHKNLFDLELLAWALSRGGFTGCRRANEVEFLQRFPEFPHRNDDYHSIYVVARKHG